jgi:hypothetical protein
MIIYNQAFDLYHATFRMMQLLSHFKHEEYLEVDRLRIWDFYFLFPEKVHEIKLKRDEKDVRALMKKYVSKTKNPYEIVLENRKLFEKIKPYQLAALNCLASYEIISKEFLQENRVLIKSRERLNSFAESIPELSAKEHNVVSLMTSHFYQLSMFGTDGLKARTNLMESKYDA